MAETLKGIVSVQKYSKDSFTNNLNYYFDIATEHSISLQNQITDNWVENNTAIQDNIAQSPLIITLRGLSAYKNLTYTTEEAESDLERALIEAKIRNDFADYTSKLTALSVLYPPVSNITQLAMNVQDYIDASVNRYKGIVDKFLNNNSPIDVATGSKGSIEETRLKEIYRKLSTLRKLNTAFLVATPYGVHENMYIQSLLLRQGESNYVTDIELTMKQINFSDVLVTKADENVKAKYAKIQQAPEQNNGVSQGNNVSILKIVRSSTN